MILNKKILLALLCIICSIPVVEAQYGNRYGNRGRNGNGRQRSIIPQAQETPKKEEPLTAEQIVEQEMPKITKTLSLTPFEEAVVSTILTNSVRSRLELQLLSLEPQKVREAHEKINKTQEDELKAGLPEDKYNAFVELQENNFKKPKKKKKSKKKSEKKKDKG